MGSDSRSARWTVTVEQGDSGETRQLQCNFLYSCSGYYRYDQGYTPQFEGQETFRGRLFHAQQWPEDGRGQGLFNKEWHEARRKALMETFLAQAQDKDGVIVLRAPRDEALKNRTTNREFAL